MYERVVKPYFITDFKDQGIQRKVRFMLQGQVLIVTK